MIALYIILGILLLLFLLTLIRVQIFASFREELTVTLKVLCFKKRIIPAPPKRKKKEKPKKSGKKKKETAEKTPQEKQQSNVRRLIEKRGVSGLVSLLTSLSRIAGTALKGLMSHVVIHRLDVGIALNAGDAAETAVNYGRLCSVVYPAVNVIVASTVCKSYHVTVEPIFDSERETEVTADLHAHLRILFALIEGVKVGFKLLWLKLKR